MDELLHAINGAINELKTKDNLTSQTMAVIDELREAQRAIERQLKNLCDND